MVMAYCASTAAQAYKKTQHHQDILALLERFSFNAVLVAGTSDWSVAHTPTRPVL
jgi:hypothetical protein